MPLFIFKKHAVRLLRLVRRQPVDLLIAVNRVPQAQARTQLQIARVEAAFEQQNWPAPVERAQPLGFVQVEQRKAVGAAQRIENPLDAMAVGVRLDDGPDPRVRRGGANTRQIVTDGGAVNSR